ncbi:MAG: zinc ribbon domain-containing protein [Candidatus Lokiarchaeota archaeon]|nr:zinc ribbon domain-containing protein [Candidatus Lokiarchaeota archaeon]
MSSQIKFGLKNNAEAVVGAVSRKREFYLVVQNHQGYHLPQVKVMLTGPPKIKILIRTERYGGIVDGKSKSRLFSIIPKAEGVFNLTATLSSRNIILLIIPIEVRVGNFQKPSELIAQVVPPVSPKPITKINCPFCGEKIDSDVKFCPICGSRLEELQKEEEKAKICPNCGQELPLNAKFCAKCGVKVVDLN